jgi:hypothetical protein
VRLTRGQIQNTLRDLLGDRVHAQLAPSLDQLPDDDGARLRAAGTGPFGDVHLRMLLEIGLAAGRAVARDDQALLRFGPACIVAAAPAGDCLGAFVAALGKRAFRRALAAGQREALLALARRGADARAGIALVVGAVLQSPYFLYRVENGAARSDLAPGAVELDSYEIAARLSYGLWDTMPDAALFAAADADALRRPEGLARDVRRMIADPRTRPRLRAFAESWLALDEVPALTTDRRRLAGLDPARARDDMIAELVRFVEHVVWERRAGVAELLTSRASFARGSALASLYGHAPAPADAPATAGPGRIGLLTRAPLLLASDGESHPIQRGAFLRRQLLCEAYPLPGLDVTNEGPDIGTPEMRRMYSTRQRVTLKTAGAACAACHRAINAAGFVFEGFDGVGRARTEELVYDRAGAILARHPIDARVDFPGLDGGAVAVASPEELGQRLAASAAVQACVARQLHRFFGARPESDADGCLLRDTQAALAGPADSLLGALERVFANRATTLAGASP